MNPRTLVAFVHDIGATALTWWLAYLIRFNFDVPAAYSAAGLKALLWVVPIYLAVYIKFGLYRGIWRYASMEDIRQLLIALAIGALLTVGATLLLRPSGIPRSVFVLHPILLLVMMAGDRYLYRAWKDGFLFGGAFGRGTPVVVLGAGSAAAALISELARGGEWRVVGLFDDNPDKHGRSIGDVRILGPIRSLADYADKLEVRHAIIAMPSATVAQRRRVAEHAARAGLSVFTLPASSDILSGRVSFSQVRRVEVEDLLGRDKIHLDLDGLHRLLTDKVVLITGAGGSIGSELARQIARFEPRLMVFLEQSEFALYSIEQEFSGGNIACVAGDVKDAAQIDAVFRRYRPEVVFHAAAYKHVPLMENENAWAAVRNNVLGTHRVAAAAVEHGAGDVVFISTDKAVNPTNVMGASKRLAELVCQAFQRQTTATRFIVVRFGNVLGSSGSVIPKFREQIANGGPVTVTHPEVTRFFMLIPEAAQLVLQAGLMGIGGEILVLDMGEPVRIADLARDMIRLSGFSEDDIRIEFTGLRAGEKLYEELLADNEATLPTPHPKLRVSRSTKIPDAAWLAELLAWLEVSTRAEAETKEALMRLVPEYRPDDI
ncbi:MAG: polysaccharide biosynthesis protein [Gammaproteobacteria bacterium]|nr:polysaccharide biosynthesis protein [Gammaproteobacteria bacterium]MBU1415565.1 polysaccharide biosynthesis protein [Gammaproteobacteria bacterium]